MTTTDLQTLSSLFTSLFSLSELRRFLAGGPDGPNLVASLPGENTPLIDQAFAAADLLQRRGMVDSNLFARLLAHSPGRKADIERVMRTCGLEAVHQRQPPDSPARAIRDRLSFVVVTALPLEAEAMLAQLSKIEATTLATGTVVRTGLLVDSEREIAVSVVQSGPGNPRAAAMTVEVGLSLRPFALLFVGVAGSIKDAALGDVVAATKVYGYASGKAADEGKGRRARATFLPRPDVGNSSHRIEQRARVEAATGRWVARCKLPPLGTPRAHVGPIAAGEVVVASRRSEIYRFLRKQYSDALAVEMEGRGFLEGAHLQHAEAIVIRGISDRIDAKSSSDLQGWQPRAADNAAAFAAEVMLNVRPYT